MAKALASGPGFNQDNNPGQQGQSASEGSKFDSQDNPGKSGSAWGTGHGGKWFFQRKFASEFKRA
jgi:hypothetical protein